MASTSTATRPTNRKKRLSPFFTAITRFWGPVRVEFQKEPTPPKFSLRARNPWRDPGCGIVRSSLLPCDVVSATTVIAARNTTPCLSGFLASRNAIPQSSLVVLARQKGHNKIDDASARQMLHDAVQDEGGHPSPVATALNECAQDCQGLTTATPVG